VLRLANGANAGMLAPAGNGIMVCDLGFDGNKANQADPVGGPDTGYGINLNGDDCAVVGCRLVNMTKESIYFYLCNRSLIQGNDIVNGGKSNTQDTTHCGIILYGSDALITGNNIQGTSDFGIAIGGSTGGDRIAITNNLIRNTWAFGIATGWIHHELVIANNIVEGCSLGVPNGCGIDFGAAAHTTVTGNTVRNCNGGIVGDTCEHTTVIGNTVYDCHGSGIGLAITDGVARPGYVISGNVIHDVDQNGIGLGATNGAQAQAVIQGNSIHNCGRTGTLHQKSAILLYNITDCVIGGNIVFDTQTPKTTSYAVESFGTSDRLLVVGNMFRAANLLTGVTNLVGAGNVLANNMT
jgi:parallel beta-helix repeat protein